MNCFSTLCKPATLPQDLAAYWKFNDPELNGIYRETLVAKDSSGRGNDLRLVTLPAARKETIEKVGGRLLLCCPAFCRAPALLREFLSGQVACRCCRVAKSCCPCRALWLSTCLSSACHPAPAPTQQGSSRLEAGAMAFRNNYAMQQSFSGMPER